LQVQAYINVSIIIIIIIINSLSVMNDDEVNIQFRKVQEVQH